MSASQTNGAAAGREASSDLCGTVRRRIWQSCLASLVASAPLSAWAQPTPDPVLAPIPGQPVPMLNPAPVQAIPGPGAVDGSYFGPPATTQPGAVYSAPTPSIPPGSPTSTNQSVPIRPFAPTGPFDPRPPMDRRITGMPTNSQKLEVIHHRSQLVLTKDAVVRMAWSDPTIIDIVQFSEKEFSILGTRMGTTDLWLWFKDNPEPLMYTLTVVRDPSLDDRRRIDYGRIERKIALLYPNSKVYLIPLSYKIIVRGQAKDAEEASNIMNVIRGEVIAEEGRLGMGNAYGFGNGVASGADFAGGGGGGGGDALGGFAGGGGGRGNNDFYSGFLINELHVPGEFQIQVRVRIAEVRRSMLRRWGMNINVLFDNARHAITSSMGAVPILSGVFENGEITVLIDALHQNGSARVLEDATVVTLSGEPAAFLSGGEFAVPTTILGGGAVGAATTSFRGFGTSVIATPTVVDDDLIRMQIIPELSSLNSGNSVNGIFGLNVSRVQTRVELREGQSIVLGGLFSRAEKSENSRIPLLGEIPVIGSYLFNSKRATEDEAELLIIVTPELVRPMDADQVPPLPGFYITHPDDIDFCHFNRIEGNPDLSHYQLLPFGNGNGTGQNVGYNFYQPNPQNAQLSPPANGSMGPGGLPGNGQQGPYAPTYGQQAPYGQPAPYGAPAAGPYPQAAPQYGPAPGYGAPNYGAPVQPQYGPQPTPAVSNSPISSGNGRSNPQVVPQPQPGPAIQQTSGTAPRAVRR